MTYDAVPLIPRDVLFGNPERVSPTLSPDGTRLGFIAPLDGVLNVWVGNTDDPSSAAAVTDDTGRGVRMFAFCHDDKTLVYLQDTDGDEDWRLYALDLQSGEATLITPEKGVTAGVLAHNRWHPTTMLVGLNADNPELHDVYRLDLSTREIEKVETNPGYAAWLIDSDLHVRGGAAMTEDGGMVTFMRNDDGVDEPWLEIGQDDVATTGVTGFSLDGRTAYVISSVGVNAGRLLAVDVATGAETVVAEDPEYDVAGVAAHPETLEPQAVTFVKDRKVWYYLDDAFGKDIDHLRVRLGGEVGVNRAARDDRRWLVSDVVADGPVRHFTYDRDSRELGFLFSHKPQLDEYHLADMEPFSRPVAAGVLFR